MRSTYRDFIDAMADLARSSVIANRIRANGHAERTNDRDLALNADEAERKRLLLSMTGEQRDVVARLLQEERLGGIHDVIANLDSFDVRLDGKSLFEQADEEPKFDLMGRIEGEPWYED
ncbi:MAG: DUF6547 family protein [Novosphingobium sp.]